MRGVIEAAVAQYDEEQSRYAEDQREIERTSARLAQFLAGPLDPFVSAETMNDELEANDLRRARHGVYGATVRQLEQALTQLKASVAEYLAHPSLDGSNKRTGLRAALQDHLDTL